MAKSLKARECADGEWLVEITRHYIAKSVADVYDLIRQNGLQMRTVTTTDSGNSTIYAD